jgi:outer membrane lipoprotein-sorting protein
MLILNGASRAAQQSPGNDLMARARSTYAGLKSYSDTGTLVIESGAGGSVPSIERHTFKTFFRAPRHFYFDFIKDPNAGADRFVLWIDAEAAHTWWATTGVEDAYPPGSGIGAFAIASAPTEGAVMGIAPLLFAKSGLGGDVFENFTSAGTEMVNGHQCQRLNGIAKSVYQATGRVTNIRKASVWIDQDTLLFRKIFTDTPQGTVAGSVMQSTLTFEPQANPTLDDAKFKFTPPSRP